MSVTRMFRRLARPRRLHGIAALLIALSLSGRTIAADMLVNHSAAARIGLERAWFAQIPLDPARSRVGTWYLYHDRLYGVTDSGIVTALDSETGAQVWSKQVGKAGFPAFGPGANDKYLGLVSGVRLYLLDRHDGTVVWVRELGGAPSSGPALSSEFAFVALVTGRIEGYAIDDPKTQPWYYQSSGRTYLRPTVTGRVVSWPTSAGFLYVGRADDPGVLFRLETSDDIVTSPAAQSPYLYIASLDGYLYCVHEFTGRERWRFSTGYSISSSPAIVAERAFVASFQPALHAVDVATGKELWTAAGASHFAAMGKDRVYASDRYGNLLALDGKTGQQQGALPASEGTSTLVNDQSDRIFLVNDRGLVQCLHEIGADQPTIYRTPHEPEDAETVRDADAGPVEAPDGIQPPAAEAGADQPRPLRDPADPGDEEPMDDEPAAGPGLGDDPFR